RGQDVLLMSEPVDPFFIEAMREYKGKQFKAVDKGAVDSEEEETEESKAAEKPYKKLLKSLNKKIDEVKDIRISKRLKESAACLVADKDQMNAQMQRIMKNFGQADESPRILELNPEHPAVKTMLTLYEDNPRSKNVEEFGRLFYDQALIAEGSKIKDPAAFAKRINTLIANSGK
ncbi:molecular chaperone HtpG, partial [PVC group bacterium]|nr:molecular chaperone HtpG [PVC group bacterium]